MEKYILYGIAKYYNKYSEFVSESIKCQTESDIDRLSKIRGKKVTESDLDNITEQEFNELYK